MNTAAGKPSGKRKIGREGERDTHTAEPRWKKDYADFIQTASVF